MKSKQAESSDEWSYKHVRRLYIIDTLLANEFRYLRDLRLVGSPNHLMTDYTPMCAVDLLTVQFASVSVL